MPGWRQRPPARRGSVGTFDARSALSRQHHPYNSTPDAKLGATGDQRIRAFSAILEAKGIACTVRIPMGRDIAARLRPTRAETQPRAYAELAGI